MNGYLQTKAQILLERGVDAYRESDWFKLPPRHWEAARLDRVVAGCRQLVAGRGESAEEPLTGLGVAGAHDLLAAFAFRVVRVRSIRIVGVFADEMTARHRVSGLEVLVFNLVGGQ